MQTLTYKQTEQVNGAGECPLPLVINSTFTVLITYLIWASFSDKNYGMTGIVSAAVIGFGLGVIGSISG